MNYDKTSPESIEKYGQRLINGALSIVQGVREVPQDKLNLPISGQTRGSLGGIVEEYYFDIHPDNASGAPDFDEAGVELKTTPARKKADGSFVAKERLVLGMINYLEEAQRDFSTSSYFKKNEKLMLISYLHEDNKTIGDIKFIAAKLYEFENFPEEDKKIIREDWEKINAKIRAGLAHELSEGDTMYLGACTKSARSENRREQVGGIPAKPRAFSYKSSYMTALLKRELNGGDTAERLLKDSDVHKTETFEQQVLNRFKPFIGKTIEEITNQINITLNPRQKDKFATLARAMLGIKGKRVEEFESAGVSMKTIQLKQNGTPKEAMSFPTFKYKEIVNEVWDGDIEEGEVRADFQKQLESRFLFIVYRYKDSKGIVKVLDKVFFWTMPASDLSEAQKVWNETVHRIKEGLANVLPKATESSVAHVRPHARNAKDTYETPQGEMLVKKCFWLNTDYLKRIISSN